jgi:uncharacterized repeat protein (TIGR02543 family)
LTLAGCEDLLGKKEDDPRTLVIQSIPAAVYAYGAAGGNIGIFPATITDQQAAQGIGIVAGASLGDATISGNDPYTMTIQLYDPATGDRWTGQGSYTVYVELYGGGGHYYKVSSVAISQAITTISFNSASVVTADGGGGTPNTLIITGITGDELQFQSRHGYSVGVFPAGTSDEDMLADFMAFFAESGDIAYLIAGSDESDTPTTISASLVTLDTESPWTGSGTFTIGLILYDGDVAYIYRVTDISITPASTSIAMSSFSKIMEYPYGESNGEGEKPTGVVYVRFVDGDRIIDTQLVYPGGNATPPSDPKKDGYTFDGWDGDYTNINSNTTITAKWKTNEQNQDTYYTVWFMDGDRVIDEQQVIKGGNATPPSDPTKDGHQFIRWTESLRNITSDRTINSYWDRELYLVRYEDGFGEYIDAQYVYYGDDASRTVSLNENRPGYEFTGWDHDGKNITGNTTITAQWREKIQEYTVTFDAQGGSASQSSITVNEGSSVTDLPTATRSTYTFEGWYTQTNGGGSQFTAGTAVYSNRTVYAKWVDNGINLRDVGVYIGIISFAGDAIDLTAPVLLDSSGRYNLINTINSGYAISSQGGTALFYGVHRALENLTNITTYPDKLESVNVITFTDGLDNGSTGRSALNPIEDRIFDTEAEYATYVDGEIDSRAIDGKPITGYSMGIRGPDVTNIPLFQSNLEKIASDGKAYELTDYSQLEAAFEAIAGDLQIVHSSTNFNMKTTLLSSGTRVRMTFDVTGAGSPDAEGSSKYLEGSITRTGTGANVTYTLGNITYSDGLSSIEGTGPITGVINGSEITFAFTGMEGYNPATDESRAKQWTMASGTTAWQINSEYSISGATNIDVEMSSAIIYLVLDASASMNSSQIGQVRNYVTAFINSVYNNLIN